MSPFGSFAFGLCFVAALVGVLVIPALLRTLPRLEWMAIGAGTAMLALFTFFVLIVVPRLK